MTIPILCLVVVCTLAWVYLLKLQIETLRCELAMLKGHNKPDSSMSSYSGQKGMRRVTIGRDML